MTQLDKVVFSRTLQHAVWANTRICGQDLVDEIRRMKADSDVPMRTMGSPSLARQLLSAGLVDRPAADGLSPDRGGLRARSVLRRHVVCRP
jgi:dihydrofolate reductase